MGNSKEDKGTIPLAEARFRFSSLARTVHTCCRPGFGCYTGFWHTTMPTEDRLMTEKVVGEREEKRRGGEGNWI